jgi:hypothetical protein
LTKQERDVGLGLREGPQRQNFQAETVDFDGTTSTVVYLPFGNPDLRGKDVERFNQFSFYQLGETFANLSRYQGNVPYGEVMFEIFDMQLALKGLLDGSPIPIGVSRPKARELLERLDEIEKEFLTEPKPGNPPVPEWKWDSLKRAISNFVTVFREEMRETATYYVPRRGIFYTPALVDAADESFPKDLLPFIPEKARNDWKAAGRCLAFNLLSASGFHTVRAVEAMLESYYQLFSGKPGKTLKSWSDYKKALDTIAASNPTPAPQAKTLIELDQMREDYRNPIVHPRVVLTEGDARMLFANGESIIIAMAQEIAEIARDGVQSTLALVGGKAVDDQGEAGQAG